MSHFRIPAVRLERQPHRNAVARLREAYRRLKLAQPPQPAEQEHPSTTDQPETGVGCPSTSIVQEVSS